MSLLRYFKSWIPTPEEADISSKETEVANNERILDIANNKSQIVDFVNWQIIKIAFQRFCSFGQKFESCEQNQLYGTPHLPFKTCHT